jgi:Protein of unknown function (DUF2752)
MYRIHRDRLGASAVVAVAAGGLSFVYLLDPETSDLYPTCPFLSLTGFYCPGCGTLRALHQLTRGHPIAALDLNPLMMLLLPFIAYFLASHAMLAVTGRPLRTYFVRPALIWALLGVVLVYWLLRNIPAYPFTLLAP